MGEEEGRLRTREEAKEEKELVRVLIRRLLSFPDSCFFFFFFLHLNYFLL